MGQPRFLVCTMYCGEPDMPHHLKAMSEQGVIIDHLIFSYMSEIDGHNAVYQTFNSAGPEWIRAKIDADVVLSPGILATVRCRGSMWVDPHTHDFFTDQLCMQVSPSTDRTCALQYKRTR